MKTYMIFCFSFLSCFAKAQIKTITPGEVAPDIKLLNVDSEIISFNDYPDAKGFIVVFMCNTCPYSKAYEKRVIELNSKYSPLGFPVLAINPNDPESSPGDSFDKMKERAQTSKYTFPYLYDKGQIITSLYGPKSTPTAFVISKTTTGDVVEYTGAIDNDTPDTNPNKIKYVEDALSALLQNKKPAITVTKAIGCRISWRKNKQG